jgi:hypothetical protein
LIGVVILQGKPLQGVDDTSGCTRKECKYKYKYKPSQRKTPPITRPVAIAARSSAVYLLFGCGT